MPEAKDLGEYALREAALADIDVLIHQRNAMWVEAANVRDQKVLDTMAKAYRIYLERAFPDGIFKAWLIAAKNGQIVAGGGISIYEQPPRPQDDTLRYVYVHSIFTEEAHRRRGLARAVLSTIIEWCRENKFKTLTLHAVDTSKPLYESAGFKPTTEMRMFL